MSQSCCRPLLTFAVVAFNQERFIREAVEAALAQSYSPLEVVLSDDCSKDHTFDIMREIARRYRGPHKVVLNQNEMNLGLVPHVNRVVDLATAELIVGAAGDDVSLPERVRLTAEAWEASGRRATSIHGRRLVIDEHGCPVHDRKWSDIPWPKDACPIGRQFAAPMDFVKTRLPTVAGCAHAFSKALFAEFGRLPVHITNEDTALAFRSLLVGQIYYINEPLVRYRRHVENVFCPINIRRVASKEQLRAYHAQVARETGRWVNLYDSFRADVQTVAKKGKLSPPTAAALSAEIDRVQKRHRLASKLSDSRFGVRLGAALSLMREGHETRYACGRLLPRFLSEFIFLTRARCRRNAETK